MSINSIESGEATYKRLTGRFSRDSQKLVQKKDMQIEVEDEELIEIQEVPAPQANQIKVFKSKKPEIKLETPKPKYEVKEASAFTTSLFSIDTAKVQMDKSLYEMSDQRKEQRIMISPRKESGFQSGISINTSPLPTNVKIRYKGKEIYNASPTRIEYVKATDVEAMKLLTEAKEKQRLS